MCYNFNTMRIIALDIGDKRIGIALSEPNFSIALPYMTYERKNSERDFIYLSQLAKDKGAQVIVCGVPYKVDGTDSFQTQKTRRFIEKLKEYTDIPIAEQDERYTTHTAQDLLIGADVRRGKRKQVIDKIAASYILESYLNRQKKQQK